MDSVHKCKVPLGIGNTHVIFEPAYLHTRARQFEFTCIYTYKPILFFLGKSYLYLHTPFIVLLKHILFWTCNHVHGVGAYAIWF